MKKAYAPHDKFSINENLCRCWNYLYSDTDIPEKPFIFLESVITGIDFFYQKELQILTNLRYFYGDYDEQIIHNLLDRIEHNVENLTKITSVIMYQCHKNMTPAQLRRFRRFNRKAFETIDDVTGSHDSFIKSSILFCLDPEVTEWSIGSYLLKSYKEFPKKDLRKLVTEKWFHN